MWPLFFFLNINVIFLITQWGWIVVNVGDAGLL
jgi:hypothetical protein